MTQIEIEDIGKCKKRLKVTIPPGIVALEINRISNEIQFSVDMPGFRKGKVPKEIILQKYKDVIYKQVIDNIIPSSIKSIAVEKKINMLMPAVMEKTDIGLDDSLKYEVSIEYIPNFDLKEYKGIELTKHKVKIADEEIQKFLEDLQRRSRELIVVEGRKPTDKDHVFLDIDVKIEGETYNPKNNEKNVEFILGNNELLPAIEDAVKNMDKGESKIINSIIPKDHPDTSIADKNAIYEIKLGEIKEEKLPEINDDFAKDIGKFNNIEELKSNIKFEILKNKEQQIISELKKQLKDFLISTHDFEVPDSMIKKEEKLIEKEINRTLESNETKFENLSKEEQEKIKHKITDSAYKNVKASVIFDEIAEREKDKIKIDDKEVDSKIDFYGHNIFSESDFNKFKNNKNIRLYFYMQILTEKVYDFLISCAKINEIE
ncbi:MAG: trigger factor [Candidatus Firestonebacteria bacterium]|nr:trigger factor [Candidatus Firestonebacteria bacterium]